MHQHTSIPPWCLSCPPVTSLLSHSLELHAVQRKPLKHSHINTVTHTRPQEKWASFHNSSSSLLCMTLLYWPIFSCLFLQSWLKQHRSNCMFINFTYFGFQRALCHHNLCHTCAITTLKFPGCRAMRVAGLILWTRCIILHQCEERWCVVTLR